MRSTSRALATVDHLSDFSTDRRVLLLSAVAVIIGGCAAVVAVVLLKLISLFTNLFFYQRFSLVAASPADHQLGPWVVVVPVLGALIVGVLARYGSERIRGHGIPEAIEIILLGGSKIEPRVACLKPLSAAISIGSGGPFGAEGPIIVTGGAFGSLVSQFLHLSSAERKTLLACGSAAGMAGTFGTPLAATLLAVELLLFEWKPRSFIPVALACASAATMRHLFVGAAPLFASGSHPAMVGPSALLGCVLAGLVSGVFCDVITAAVYGAEDLFRSLPLHWMWWPAVGAVVVGLGGWIEPRAFGVGYELIQSLVTGGFQGHDALRLMIAKGVVWVVALGSGTSGGVLAPLLILGGSLGALGSAALPALGPGFWPLIGMGSVMAATMHAPFAGIVFILEVTQDLHMLLPLLAAVPSAYGFTVLTMKRSLMTEKLSRRGFHLSREYAMDPLEIVFVREAMQTDLAIVPEDLRRDQLEEWLHRQAGRRSQRLYPVMSAGGRFRGVITAGHLQAWRNQPVSSEESLSALISRKPHFAFPDEPLSRAVCRMAESGRTRLPVVDREDPGSFLGIVSLESVLDARRRTVEAERKRERPLSLLASTSRPSAPSQS